MSGTNGHTLDPVVCHVALEDLLASVEAPDEDFQFLQAREHLSAGCASCVRRLLIIRDLLEGLLEPRPGEY